MAPASDVATMAGLDTVTNRRAFLGTLASAGVVGVTGVGALRGHDRLSEPSVHAESPRRRALEWRANGEAVGSLGVTGRPGDGAVELDTELWHRRNTSAERVELRLWMPETVAHVAVVSPVQGDSSPPPDVSLSAAPEVQGALVVLDDLDDLADETIDTLDLRVEPLSTSAEALAVDAMVRLDGNGWFDAGFTLTGRLNLRFPDLGE